MIDMRTNACESESDKLVVGEARDRGGGRRRCMGKGTSSRPWSGRRSDEGEGKGDEEDKGTGQGESEGGSASKGDGDGDG